MCVRTYVCTCVYVCRRIIFLETVAAVPGMIAAMTRHLRSLRHMQRDYGWIHTLLGEWVLAVVEDMRCDELILEGCLWPYSEAHHWVVS